MQTTPSPDVRVQDFVATARGALIDLAWQAPNFDETTRELIGYELFRDDMSTRPPSRLTWRTMPAVILEARGLEVLPHSEYGVQPIWRLAATEPPASIEFGPPRLSNEAGSSRQVAVMPDERIRALAWLQRDGLITSQELELAIEELLGTRAQPAPEPEVATVGARSSAKPTKVLAGGVGAVLLLLVVVMAGPSASHLLFTQQAARSSPSPLAPSPSPSPSGRPVNLRPILIKPTDLKAGYVAGPYDYSPLCSACSPGLSSLTLVLQNRQLRHTVLTAASVASSAADSTTMMQALMNFRSSGHWSRGNRLGDESYVSTTSSGALSSFFVVWRSGVVVDEIVLSGRKGSITMQNALDLARLQQLRTTTIHA